MSRGRTQQGKPKKKSRTPLVRTLRHLLRNPKMSLGAKALGALIVDHADDEGVCYPSQDELATLLGVDARTVRRAMSELRDGGYIETKGRLRKNGRGRSTDTIIWQTNLFPLLMVHHGVENPGTNRTPVSGSTHDQPDKNVRPTGHQCPGDTMKYPTEVPKGASAPGESVENSPAALALDGGNGIGPGSLWQEVKNTLRLSGGGAA